MVTSILVPGNDPTLLFTNVGMVPVHWIKRAGCQESGRGFPGEFPTDKLPSPLAEMHTITVNRNSLSPAALDKTGPFHRKSGLMHDVLIEGEAWRLAEEEFVASTSRVTINLEPADLRKECLAKTSLPTVRFLRRSTAKYQHKALTINAVEIQFQLSSCF